MSLFRQPASVGPAHEPDTTNVRSLVAWTVGLVALLVLTMFVVGGLLGLLSRVERPRARPPRLGSPSAEHWRNPPTDLERLRRREDENLNRYGWVDRDNGVARIPIERAMELMAGGEK